MFLAVTAAKLVSQEASSVSLKVPEGTLQPDSTDDEQLFSVAWVETALAASLETDIKKNKTFLSNVYVLFDDPLQLLSDPMASLM